MNGPSFMEAVEDGAVAGLAAWLAAEDRPFTPSPFWAEVLNEPGLIVHACEAGNGDVLYASVPVIDGPFCSALELVRRDALSSCLDVTLSGSRGLEARLFGRRHVDHRPTSDRQLARFMDALVHAARESPHQPFTLPAGPIGSCPAAAT